MSFWIFWTYFSYFLLVLFSKCSCTDDHWSGKTTMTLGLDFGNKHRNICFLKVVLCRHIIVFQDGIKSERTSQKESCQTLVIDLGRFYFFFLSLINYFVLCAICGDIDISKFLLAIPQNMNEWTCLLIFIAEFFKLTGQFTRGECN